MATIVYSLSGEGRGHAARAQVLAGLLRARHRIIFYAYGAALPLLRPLADEEGIEVREIPGLRFCYDRHGTLDRPASFCAALPFLARLPERARSMAQELEKAAPDLLISDFEPILPRAAALVGLPLMSVDHQQFLTHYDLSALPRELRRKAEFLAPFVRPYYPCLTRAVISSFFFPPLKKAKHLVDQVGVLLRSDVLSATPHLGQHLVAYVRHQAPPGVLEALAQASHPVHVYGLGERPSEGRLSFRAVEAQAFAEDLSQSAALVTTAGNQVVGEALYLKKPVLCYPEPGNFEQHVNGFFLGQSGQGWAHEAPDFTPRLVQSFVREIPRLADRIRPGRLNGNGATVAVIEAELSATRLRSAARESSWGGAASLRQILSKGL